jgi:predicted ATPase
MNMVSRSVPDVFFSRLVPDVCSVAQMLSPLESGTIDIHQASQMRQAKHRVEYDKRVFQVDITKSNFLKHNILENALGCPGAMGATDVSVFLA